MKNLWQDLRYGARTLFKDPGFTLIAVATLALGIGANAAIFSVVNGVLLKSLPFPEPDRLVVLSETSKDEPIMSVAYPNYLDWRVRQAVFENMAARMSAGGVLTGDGGPERVIGHWVTASFFSTLGIQPHVGQFFTEEEDRLEAERVIVLSHGLWQRRFGGDPHAIGRPLRYNGDSWTVVGVMPIEFDFYGRDNVANDFFIPLGRFAGQEYMRSGDAPEGHTYRIIGELKYDSNDPKVLQSAVDAIKKAFPWPIMGKGHGQYSDSNREQGPIGAPNGQVSRVPKGTGVDIDVDYRCIFCKGHVSKGGLGSDIRVGTHYEDGRKRYGPMPALSRTNDKELRPKSLY